MIPAYCSFARPALALLTALGLSCSLSCSSPASDGGAASSGAGNSSAGTPAAAGTANGSAGGPSGAYAGGQGSTAGAAGTLVQAGGTDGGGASSGGASGSAGAASGVGGGSGAAGAGGSGAAPTHKEFILYDDAAGRLLYVNNDKPSANWTSNSGSGRDLQLVGGGLVMLGKSDGWDEYRLSDGMKAGGQHGFSGTQSAHRLANGNTLLASVSGTSIVLKLIGSSGQVQSQITYPGFSYVRLVRPTASGTYLVGADSVAFEGDASGKVLSTWTIPAGRHVWKAMRLASGKTVVSSGYGATLVVFDSAGKIELTIGGKNQPNASAIAPEFYADFHVMPNGDYFVANSQADRTMDNSIQLLEYDPSGKLVWQQKQPAGVHSVEEAIVLDGLDTSKLQIEPEGQLTSAP